MADPPYVLGEEWYTLAEAQERVGIPGTRGKRLHTLLRRIEREQGVTLIRETTLPSGKKRREVSEWTLWDLFPEKFKTEIAELERVLAEVRAANDPRSRVLRKVHGYFRSRIDALIERDGGARSTLRPNRVKRKRARVVGATTAPPSADRSQARAERKDDAEEPTTEPEPPSGGRSR